jgi:hypothetical protein
VSKKPEAVFLSFTDFTCSNANLLTNALSVERELGGKDYKVIEQVGYYFGLDLGLTEKEVEL